MRDDPLSMFLAVSAVLLAVMYVLEEQDIGDLESASQRALELGASSLDIPGCTTTSAGARGQTLVIRCDGAAAAAIDSAAQRTPDLAGFQEVVFVGTDEHRVCSTVPQQWADGCTPRAAPTAKQDSQDAAAAESSD